MDTRKIIFIMVLTLIGFSSPGALAQGLSNSDDPIEITADSSLEWKRAENLFIANKNAKAVQGDVSIAAAKLTAKYRETPQSAIQIWQMNADSNVVIQSPDNTAYGDNAIYNIDQGLATMTGQNLRLIAPNQIITARDKFEYWVNNGKLIAIGNARVEQTNERGEVNILEADRVTATLRENVQGKRTLDTLEAQSNVVITTPTEVISGSYGIYNAQTKMAELTGGVTINRGPNILEGERAEVNLNTNVSRLFGGNNSSQGTSDGRVRGVFYPKSENQNQDQNTQAPQNNGSKLDQRLLTP